MDNIRTETDKFAPFQHRAAKQNKTLVVIGIFAHFGTVEFGAVKIFTVAHKKYKHISPINIWKRNLFNSIPNRD